MAADSLLTNGSFEEAGDQGLPEGWRLCADVGDAPTVARITDEGGHPGAFVRLSRTSDGQADVRPVAGLFPVDQKASYLLTARLRASNTTPGSHGVELQWFVSGMDIYPVEGANHSDLANKTLSVVGDEVDKNRQTVHDRKSIWAILQGFGWSVWEKDPSLHKRAPTWAETRFMAYDAILHGATGIIYWGASYEDRDSDIWDSLRRMASELKDLTPALVSSDIVDVEAESPDGTVIAMGRRVGGKLWVLAVNERDAEVEAKLKLPDGAESLERWREDGDRPSVRGSDLIDSFGPYSVHVYIQR